jgi:hypothetical protein
MPSPAKCSVADELGRWPREVRGFVRAEGDRRVCSEGLAEKCTGVGVDPRGEVDREDHGPRGHLRSPIRPGRTRAEGRVHHQVVALDQAPGPR